jgi:hypothetical protein
MSGPHTEFDADECQALLDLMDKLCPSLRSEQWASRFGFNPEENAVLLKVREAGKIYAVEPVKLEPLPEDPVPTNMPATLPEK